MKNEKKPTNLKVRAGIVGCGRIGSQFDEGRPLNEPPLTHAKAFTQSPHFSLVALCDVNSDRVHKAQAEWKVPFATDNLEEFFSQELDVISLCATTEQQFGLLKRAIATPAKVLVCEKPLVMNKAQALEAIQLVKKSGKKFILNYTRRFDSEIQKVKNEITSLKYGSIQKVVCHYGKGLLNNGSHLLNLLDYYFGPPTHVQYLETVSDDREKTIDPTENIVLQYKDASGKTFSAFLTAHDHRHYSAFEIDIFAAGARIQIKDAGRVIETQIAEADRDFANYKTLQLRETKKDLLADAFRNVVQETYELFIGERTSSTCGIEDVLTFPTVLEGVQRSKSENGQKVELNYR